jgi:chromosome segregation ATPase
MNRSLLQDIEGQRDKAMENFEKQIRVLRAALIEEHQQELRDVEEHALKEVEHAVQELEKEKGRMLKRERELEHDRAREIEEMKAKQTQDEVTALAKQEQREREIMQEQEGRTRERELAHGEQLKERDESLAKLRDQCSGLEEEHNKVNAELQRMHNQILSLKDRENELLDLLETRDETVRTLEHQKIEKADAHVKELEQRDAVVREKEQELQLSKEKICKMEREICVKDEEVVLMHALLAEKNALLAEKDQTIMAKEEALCEHRKEHKEADEMQRALEGYVKESVTLKEQLELNASAMQKLETQAQKDAARREKELATLKEQLGLYEPEIMELERRLKEALDANAQYTHDQSKYKDEVEEVQRSMKEAISEREHQIEDRCRHATHLKRHIDELSAEMERNQEALGQKIADQEQRIAQLQEEKSQHLALANTLTAAIEEKVSDIAHLNQTISSRDEDIVQLNTLVETYSTQIATRERERDAALAERESTMVAAKQALVQLEAELRGKAAKIDEIKAEASSRNEEMFVARAEMSELAMELSKATEALGIERGDAQERLGAKETQLADLKTKMQTLMAQVEVLQTKLSVVHCEFGMTKEELENTKNQVCIITAALDKANQERDSGAQALESIKQERNIALKEKDREVFLRTEETTVLKERCAKILQEREAALLQVSQFAQQLAAREQEKEIQKVLRSENKRLVAELKATAEKLALQEGKTKQQAATLKTRNDEIIKLSKVLRAAENNLASGAAAATGTGDTNTPTKNRGNPLATVRKHDRGGGKRGDEEILRDQIEELMNSVARLEEKLQFEMERGQQMEEELLTRQHELHACKREVETCRLQSGLARQIEGDLQASIAAQQEQLTKLEADRTSFEQENIILNQRASVLGQKVSDLGERLTSSEKLCNTLEDHLSEARTSAAQETALAGRSEQLWKSVAELENQVLEQRREGQKLLGQLSEREDQVRALVEERDQAKGACLRSQQACKASQAAAEQVQNELAASQTLADTMKTTYLLLEGREHDLAHALGAVCNAVGHRIDHLEQCMQTIQVETARAVDRARAARCVESIAKTRLAEIGHENVDLRKLLQAKVEEIVQLQRAKENLLRSQLVAAAEGERERARMHNAIVTVQTSHTSLLECNTTLRNTCKQLQADLDSLRSQKSGEAQATSTGTSNHKVAALDQTKVDAAGIIQLIAASDHITRSDGTLGFKNKGGAIGAEGAPLALGISLGQNCEKKRNAQTLHAEIAILRKEKRMLHHQLADLQMQYDEMAAQVHSAKLEVESMQSEATAAHTDLEVCALEINRLQESLAKERDEKESLAREIQTRGLSEKLEKELQRSTNFGGDGWDANGGPFLRTPSETNSCSNSHQWGDEKASLLLQNAWLRDALRTRGKVDNFGRDHVLILPPSQSVHRNSSVSSDSCALSREWAEAPVANDASDLCIAAGSTIFDRSGSVASGPVALHNDVVVTGVAGKGKDRKRNWGVEKSYAEMFERRSKVVGERQGIEDSFRGIRQPRELASTSPRPPPAAVCAPLASTAPATEVNGGPDSRPPPLPPSKQPSAGPAAGPGEPPVAHYRFF